MIIDPARGLRLAAPVALLLLIASCGSTATGSGDDGGSSPETLAADGPLVSCGSFAYPPSAFDGPSGAELADDAAADALRDLIDNPAGLGPIPESDWRRLYDNDEVVVFGSGQPLNDGTERGLTEVVFKDDGDGFTFYQSAYGCTPRAQVGGRSEVEFAIAEAADMSPESTAVAVVVIETQCTGGASLGDRLNRPLVRYGPEVIEVLYTATPLEGESFGCPGNPSSTTILHLDEPIGDRRILDLSGYPPRDATTPGRSVSRAVPSG